ncbi:putative benzoate 4-monooxygenase cytochrome P450 [Hypomontagnella submonticulosa]|nr:putative benzoate 4-monooxygenase cytochrome P450 [Hypomontagnella submonticulosa]
MNPFCTASFSGFGLFAEGHASQVVLPGVFLGVLFHLIIAQMGEVENFMYRLLAGFFLTLCSLASTYFFLGFSIIDTLARLFVLASSFNAGLFSSMVIYRLFFHRLRRFPGPLDTKISRVFSAIKAAKEVKYYKEVAKMHDEYGDFIRTGPRELCIVRGSAISTIYGPNSKCPKSTWYAHMDADPKKSSIDGTRDVDDHRRRRRAWDRGFSTKALNTYEPRIKALADQFVSQISQRKGLIDVTAWSMFLSFDIMGDVGFGKRFDCVSTGIEHPAIKAIHDHMIVLGIMSHVPWLINMLARIPGVTAGYASFFNYCHSQIAAKQKDFDLEKYPQDIMSWLLKAVIEKDISASPTKASLDEDARVIIVAGSETTATTLASALFFLAKHPSVYQKLQSQVDAAMPTPSDWTYDKAKSITYIDNIIDESLRLKPAVPTGATRVTPKEGIQIDEQFIPGDTNVFVPISLIQTDPRYWKQATEFIPERWGERSAEMGTNGAPYLPFYGGPYACPGKPLAMMSLRITLSKLAQHFDLSFAPGETGETFDKEVKDTFTITLQPLMLQFTPRTGEKN